MGLGQMNGEMKEATPDCCWALNSNQGHPEDRRLSTLRTRKTWNGGVRAMGAALVTGLVSNIKGTAEISFNPDLWSPLSVVVIFLPPPSTAMLTEQCLQLGRVQRGLLKDTKSIRLFG